MKKLLAILVLFLAGTMVIQAQTKRYAVYGVGFYNLENLFDTCHDAGKNDYEYLPDGRNRWTGLKYSHKLKNMQGCFQRWAQAICRKWVVPSSV
jgi:hypothetical protein